ncbi:MAG: MFS transporter [Chloroflexi bacterium]|nr:MFS transporter [Chloroflexota bacterium]MYD49170.1 MFS transporter [Chloroflexota bacterium]
MSGIVQFRRPKIFYGWYIVFATGFVMTIATVPLFHAMTLWAVALENHFGWPRGQLSLALTLTRIEGGLMGPVEGYLTDKLGGRRMVLIGFLILGLGFLIFWQIDAAFWPVAPLYMFYAAYMVMALGQGMGSWVPMMTTINNWFSRRMASAMGWANFMSRGGALLIIPLIDLGINGSVGVPFTDITLGINHVVGWEGVAFILAVVIFAVALPLSFIIRNRPEDIGLRPDGENVPATRAGRRAAAAQAQGLTAQQAVRTPAFWLIAVGHGMTSMIILAIFTHLGLLLKDAGFEQYAGTVVILYTLVSMFSQPLGGYVGDRFPKRIGLFVFTSIQASAVVLLTFSTELWMFYTFAVIFGIGFGGRNPLTTSIRGEYFGRGNFGKILGISTIPMNGLLLISSPFAGYMYDWQNSYTIAFLVLAAFNYAGGVCFLFAKRPRIPNTPEATPSVPASAAAPATGDDS